MCRGRVWPAACGGRRLRPARPACGALSVVARRRVSVQIGEERNAMPRPDKVSAVAEIADAFRTSNAAVLTEYRGLSVKELTQLRRALGAGTSFAIVKNTLTKIAAKDAGVDGLGELLTGPTAVAFVEGDPVEAAKGLRDFAEPTRRSCSKGACSRVSRYRLRRSGGWLTWSRGRCSWPGSPGRCRGRCPRPSPRSRPRCPSSRGSPPRCRTSGLPLPRPLPRLLPRPASEAAAEPGEPAEDPTTQPEPATEPA